MIIQFKHFRDSLNIALILASGCEFFSTKCVQFSLKAQSKVKDNF